MTRICIIAGNELEAYQFAQSQNWDIKCWFFPYSERDLLFKTNFHVLVVGTAGFNSLPSSFEKIYNLALERGKIGRS
jgi:hypothetical protein